MALDIVRALGEQPVLAPGWCNVVGNSANTGIFRMLPLSSGADSRGYCNAD